MSTSGPTRRVLVTVLAAIAVQGCSPAGEEGGTPLTAGTGAPVIIPQGPGAPGRTASPGERLGESESRPGAADVAFAESMIPHHRQALEMAALAAGRDAGETVTALAGRITVAQGPEIEAMGAWLTALGRPVPAGHAHLAGRFGMATLEQMNRLRAARGRDFDRLFLQLMIAHHEGALTMARTQLAQGTDRLMRLMAKDVHAGQAIEITRMRRLLGR
ncbi:lipoprotein [Microtetraspora sp. NBRC 13810]|uniref:DUF305 domain-containing protein n=1 Tax=Microtetraspora sp. NBRC 13810 TaxID=3030990 RepID=UPI0024A0A367|nr:DUF305 domain-containing protein [Microtetraspora sp. NBRC 13810]GLW11048.1 lipoprotein [Microtetraspora sp. NBRC 13810]